MQVSLHPAVANFALKMQEKLDQKRDKDIGNVPGWHNMSPSDLVILLAGEKTELEHAILLSLHSHLYEGKVPSLRIAAETVDIANYGMMLFDLWHRNPWNKGEEEKDEE